MVFASATLFVYWQGSWQFERFLIDFKGQSLAFAVGDAVFMPTNNLALSYKESGTLFLSEAKIPFQRCFQYDFTTAEVQVFYADGVQNGDLYQQLYVMEDIAVGKHICMPDTYKNLYHFSPKSFDSMVIVQGSAKEYCLYTIYQQR
jgi:Family of unknown function (DUF6314)